MKEGSPELDRNDPEGWMKVWISPPDGEGLRKLWSAIGGIDEALPYLQRVKKYVLDGPLRDELEISLYDGTAWGVIRWRKSLGHPSTLAMAESFSVRHQYLFEVQLGQNADGSDRIVAKWLDSLQAELWDGPHDEETYAVSFMVHSARHWTNRVLVELMPGIEWQPVEAPYLTQRRRVVAYPASLPGGEFNFTVAPQDLGVFEVVRTW